jgi:glycolate oxidase FAD binding subunit
MSSPPQAATRAAAPWDELAGVVGPEHIRPATPADSIDGVTPERVVQPGSAEEVARVLRVANSAGIGVCVRGNGSKIGWGNPPQRAGLVLSTARMNKVVEHAWADMTVTVEPGCTIRQLQDTLAQHGQRLALDPLWPERATVGGVLATNDSGFLRVRFGSLRDLVIGITVALPDGTLAKSGGKVVKNVAGYDLPKLITGSLGTLAVITQAIFRLHPKPKNTRTISFELASPDTLNKLMLAVMDSQMAFTGLQFRAGNGAAPGMDIRFAGTEAGIEAQVQQARKLAAGARELELREEVWRSAQSLWESAGNSIIAKVSILPANIAKLCDAAEATRLQWSLALQAVGIGWLKLSGDDAALVAGVNAMRAELGKAGGSLVCYGCPTALKAKLDVWGPTGDSHFLMRRIKAHFDPAGTLNPGRFVGGI